MNCTYRGTVLRHPPCSSAPRKRFAFGPRRIGQRQLHLWRLKGDASRMLILSRRWLATEE